MRHHRAMPAVTTPAPSEDAITPYDEAHQVTYLRLLDADAEGADWREAARIVLGLDADAEGARQIWESHMNRARWMTTTGYRYLLGLSPTQS